MRAIFAALVLIAPLAACEGSSPTFGSGGWQEDDVPEAVPVGDEPAPAAAAPARTEPARPTPPAVPAPEVEDEVVAAPAPPLERAPGPVIVTAPDVEPVAPEPQTSQQSPSAPPPTTP